MTEAKNDIHPLLMQVYTLFTPPIGRMFEQISQWINNRVTGGYIYGRSRMGKSKAVKDWFPSMIEENYGDRVAVFRCVHAHQNHSSQVGFVRTLANGVSLSFPESLSASRLELRIGDFLAETGLQTRFRQVVLLIDEAQYLGEKDYHVLCNLQNRADDVSVRLTVITVGTQQLAQYEKAFILGSNLHLSTRFLARSAPFNGIRSAAELRSVLRGYDEGSEWPPGSKQSFTQFFFPAAYAEGLRLDCCAGDLWELYKELAPAGIRQRLEVPMEHVVAPVEWLCRHKATGDSCFRADPVLLRDALISTDYCATMRAIAGSVARSH